MTRNESMVMAAVTRFLERYGEPPAAAAPDAEAWWDNAAKEFIAFSDVYGAHPLASKLITAVFEYIEIKAKAKGDGDAVQEQ